MTDSTATRLLSAIIGDAQPCGHIERFIAFYVDSPVTLMNDTGDDHPVIGCVMCDSKLTFEQFDTLALKAAKEGFSVILSGAKLGRAD